MIHFQNYKHNEKNLGDVNCISFKQIDRNRNILMNYLYVIFLYKKFLNTFKCE
jgi:hypothetical protein